MGTQKTELIRTSQSWDGAEKVVHEGESVVEMVGTVHHGENRGDREHTME